MRTNPHLATRHHCTPWSLGSQDYGRDPYAVPKQLGLFVELPSKSALTVDTIVARIRANHERMAAKVERKMAVEKQYYENRYGFATAPEPAG